MQIDQPLVDSQAPNAAAIKNARGVVLKRKLVGLFRSADGTLLFGDCKGSGAENYRPAARFRRSHETGVPLHLPKPAISLQALTRFALRIRARLKICRAGSTHGH